MKDRILIFQIKQKLLLASMKIAFFAIFDPTWNHTLALKGPNMEFLKQNFNFQSLRKTEAILLPIM